MTDNTAQDVSQTSTQALTAANVGTLNSLYAVMREVLDDGKSLYRGSSPAKYRDYTVARLLKRLRRDQPGGEEAGEAPAPG